MKPEVLESLVPHRGPMLWLDRVVASEAERIVCSAQVREDAPFLRAGSARSVVCVEYMAQAVAAYAGTHAQAGMRPRVGFLIAAERVSLLAPLLEAGDELSVTAERTWGDATLAKFSCAVERRGECIASALLSVYQPPIGMEGAQ